jgi:hypothetical protein
MDAMKGRNLTAKEERKGRKGIRVRFPGGLCVSIASFAVKFLFSVPAMVNPFSCQSLSFDCN